MKVTDQDRQTSLKNSKNKKSINKQNSNLPIKISSRKLKAPDIKKHTKLKVVITNIDRLKTYNSQTKATRKPQSRIPNAENCRPHTEINTCSWQSEADRRECM